MANRKVVNPFDYQTRMIVTVSDGVVLAIGIVVGAIGALLTLWLEPDRSTVVLGIFVTVPVVLAFLTLKFFLRYINHVTTKKARERDKVREKNTIPTSHAPGKIIGTMLIIFFIIGVLGVFLFSVFGFSALVYWLLDMTWAVRFAKYLALISFGLVVATVLSMFFIALFSIAWEYRSALKSELKIHIRSADPTERFCDLHSAFKITNET